jgi:hypothetical protein
MDNGSETYSLLDFTQKLLDAIANKDWDTYVSFVDEKLTCIEPETGNNICEGLEFHKTYFKRMPDDDNIIIKENILQPTTKSMGDVAIICYKRVRQITNLVDKSIKSEFFSETRVWKLIDNTWKMIHFHKS